jgi:hypothetical protein
MGALQQEVGPFGNHTTIVNPFPVPSEPSLSLVTFTAEPASRSAEALGLLASWTATTDGVDRTRSEHGATWGLPASLRSPLALYGLPPKPGSV